MLYSLKTGRPGMEAAFGQPLFEYLASHPEDADNFNDAMVGMHGAAAPAVAVAYDFSRFQSLVDIGGGTGALLSAILGFAPLLQGAVFEQPKLWSRPGMPCMLRRSQRGFR